MARLVIEHGTPDRFVVGTIGLPGERTFYVQSRQGTDVVSVVVEKQQVALLAEKLSELVDEVGRMNPHVRDAEPAAEDLGPLELPLDERFRVGAFGLGWDTSAGMVVLEIHAQSESFEVPDVADDEAEGPDCLRVWLPAADVKAFVRRTTAVISAGRPPCPFCQLPLDPGGHICPRANGYRHNGSTR